MDQDTKDWLQGLLGCEVDHIISKTRNIYYYAMTLRSITIRPHKLEY